MWLLKANLVSSYSDGVRVSGSENAKVLMDTAPFIDYI